jgi:hypothetical protein
VRSALALIGVGALLAGCAGLNPAPTTAQCSASQGQLSAAEIALTTAQATLAALQAAGVGGAVVTGLEAAIPVYQQEIATLQSAVNRSCTSQGPAFAVSTPIASAQVRLGS